MTPEVLTKKSEEGILEIDIHYSAMSDMQKVLVFVLGSLFFLVSALSFSFPLWSYIAIFVLGVFLYFQSLKSDKGERINFALSDGVLLFSMEIGSRYYGHKFLREELESIQYRKNQRSLVFRLKSERELTFKLSPHLPIPLFVEALNKTELLWSTEVS